MDRDMGTVSCIHVGMYLRLKPSEMIEEFRDFVRKSFFLAIFGVHRIYNCIYKFFSQSEFPIEYSIHVSRVETALSDHFECIEYGIIVAGHKHRLALICTEF